MMKRLKIAAVAALVVTAFVAMPALARQPAKPAAAAASQVASYVVDSSKALDAEQLNDLNSLIRVNELRTGVQTIVIVAPSMGGGTITSFTNQVKETVKFAEGRKPAVLFLVAVKEKAATIIATTGTPLTASAQNAIVQRIVLPNFRLGKIGTGIYDGARAITLALQVPAITQAAQVEQGGDSFLSRWIPLIVLGVFLVGFGNSDWTRGGYYGNTGYDGRYGGGSRRY